MSATWPLPRRLDATDDDLRRACGAAHALAAAALGRDPGPMATAPSMSHYVYIGTDIVVKLVDVAGHDRLELEIVLASHLPSGLGAPLLTSGRRTLDTCDVRFACFTRMPGSPPGVGLPGVDAAMARRWAEQAVRRLDDLHTWRPTGTAEQALKESPVHEGFTGRAALMTEIEGILAAGSDTFIPRPLINGLLAIAEGAPLYAGADVPVHADCDWDNWLADDQNITALLDFERARFGVPADDWVLLAVTSGPHIGPVLDVIAEQTASSPEAIRSECEIRDAAFIAEDLRHALELPDVPPWMARRVRDLEGLITGHRWWQPAR
jgi:Phosphotransferase enzyme family